MSLTKPSLLIITNQPLAGCLGQVDGYLELVRSGELAFVDTVAARDADRYDSADVAVSHVTDALTQSKATHIMVWSPAGFPQTSIQFDRINAAMQGRPLIYWEGDPWGKGKPLTSAMPWWLKRSDVAFSVAGSPQSDLLSAAGAKHVLPIIHTYCHLKFSMFENWVPEAPRFSAAFVGNNLARVPGITGVPGSAGRWEIAFKLNRKLGDNFRLYGRNWPTSWSQGLVPYDEQPRAISESKVFVNWDHWPAHADYASDRLAIGLLAARPQITSRHPGMTWAPPEEFGFFQEQSPGDVVNKAVQLLQEDPALLEAMGRLGKEWVVGRLSHRESARYILANSIEGIRPPLMDPWPALAWSGTK